MNDKTSTPASLAGGIPSVIYWTHLAYELLNMRSQIAMCSYLQIYKRVAKTLQLQSDITSLVYSFNELLLKLLPGKCVLMWIRIKYKQFTS